MSCKCSTCSQSINPYTRVSVLHAAALEKLIENLLDIGSSSSSSSSAPVDLSCISYNEYYAAISKMIAGIDEEETEDTSPVISNVFSPVNQVFSSWSAQSLNDYCNKTGMDGYNATQLSIINMAMKNITRIPPDLLSCYLSNLETLITETTMTTEERKPLYIACAAAKGSVYYWTIRAAEPDLWAQVMSTDLGVRTARIPFQTNAAFHGSISVSAKSLTMLPPLTAAADIIAGVVGSATVSGATLILKATPGIKI